MEFVIHKYVIAFRYLPFLISIYKILDSKIQEKWKKFCVSVKHSSGRCMLLLYGGISSACSRKLIVSHNHIAVGLGYGIYICFVFLL